MHWLALLYVYSFFSCLLLIWMFSLLCPFWTVVHTPFVYVYKYIPILTPTIRCMGWWVCFYPNAWWFTSPVFQQLPFWDIKGTPQSIKPQNRDLWYEKFFLIPGTCWYSYPAFKMTWKLSTASGIAFDMILTIALGECLGPQANSGLINGILGSSLYRARSGMKKSVWILLNLRWAYRRLILKDELHYQFNHHWDHQYESAHNVSECVSH